jgi:hypothetical protein
LNIGAVLFYFDFRIQLFLFVFFLLSGIFIVKDLTSPSIVDAILSLSSESFVALFLLVIGYLNTFFYLYVLPHSCLLPILSVIRQHSSTLHRQRRPFNVAYFQASCAQVARPFEQNVLLLSYYSHLLQSSAFVDTLLLIHIACNHHQRCYVAVNLNALFTAFNCPTFIQILLVHSIFNVSHL